ncbi:efflux RND transporter periplasmic adaptor subunit [Taibaiella lutea]|uniref:Efflux RND transporter periplasmic adaptor subunit n=1 Tax=Taibaiella lutea TaxID=2608001 RepID=A0A5M6CNF5_9BACT|nr:efflux RND transporter periplasmic adaptor subunit [Taibaiella lutea]KAA5536664.1 efflux RND transporter periplasmic adaptor subunit [Taibaiella lutea]
MPDTFVSKFDSNIKPFLGLTFMSLFACSALMTGCKEKKEEEKTSKGPKGLVAEAYVVKQAPLSSIYQSSGNLLANESISVYPEVAGRITAIHFKEGGIVRKGDLLVSLNSSDIDAQIQKLRAQRKLQVTTKERQDQLLAISGISKQEYDNTVTQIASIDADIAYNQAQLRKLEIRASFDGIIGLRNVSVGAIVSSATLITTIQQIDPLKMDFLVPEQYKDIVKQNDQVHFTVTGNNDTMQGKIMAIQPQADVATHTITMRAIVPNSNHLLSPGTFTNVFITLNRKSEAITIPTQCIIPTTRDKQVAVVRKGKVDMVTVQTGERLEAKVEILQGLQAGDTILTTGIMQVKQDMPVKVKKITE